MKDTFFVLLGAAAVAASLVGFITGWVCDKLDRNSSGLALLFGVGAIAFAPLGGVLFGYLPDGVERVHGIVWMFALFAGIHLWEKFRPTPA